PLDLDKARENFVNRVYNELVVKFVYRLSDSNLRYKIGLAIASELGDKYSDKKPLDQFIGSDFFRNLQAIQAVYSCFERVSYYTNERREINAIVGNLLSRSEVDLNIEWVDGQFLRKGAGLLDEKLVNDVLKWLRQPGYESVLKPFQKGLSDFLQGAMSTQ